MREKSMETKLVDAVKAQAVSAGSSPLPERRVYLTASY